MRNEEKTAFILFFHEPVLAHHSMVLEFTWITFADFGFPLEGKCPKDCSSLAFLADTQGPHETGPTSPQI